MFNRKSEIVFIGSGKVAHTLLPLLIEKNFNVRGIVSRNGKTASSLGRKYNLDFYTADFNKLSTRHGVFFIAVPDNQISNAAGKLALLKLDFPKSLFIHTSGSESSSALKVLEKKGGVTASFHIMQTFPSSNQTEIANSYTAIETKSSAAERYLSSLAGTLKLKSFRLTEAEKVFYHMAGVFTANFLNANIFTSERLLNNTILGREEHYHLFEPIIEKTLSNIKIKGVTGSLSGPVQRGDFNTVKKHLASLKKLKVRNKKLYLHSYVSQSLILLDIIKLKERKLNSGQIKLKKILEAELNKS